MGGGRFAGPEAVRCATPRGDRTAGAVRRRIQVIDGTDVTMRAWRTGRRGARSRAYRRGRQGRGGRGRGGEVWGVRELSRAGPGGSTSRWGGPAHWSGAAT